MDRSYYLSSLPFLIPLQSQSWPPIPVVVSGEVEPVAGSTTVKNTTSTAAGKNNVSSDVQVLLGDTDKYNRSFYLSIEIATTKRTRTTTRKNTKASTQTITSKYNTIATTGSSEEKKDCDSKKASYQTAFFVSSSLLDGLTSDTKEPKSNNNNTIEESDVGMTKIQIAIEVRPITKDDVTIQKRYDHKSSNNNANSKNSAGGTTTSTTAAKYRHTSRPTTSSLSSPSRRRYPPLTNPQQQNQQKHGPSKVTTTLATTTSTGNVTSYSILYIMVQGHVYAIDIRHLRHMEIIPEVYDDDDDDATKKNHNDNDAYLGDDDDDAYLVGRYSTTTSSRRQRPISKPPNLLLRFNNNIVLRIFTYRKPSSSASALSTSRSIRGTTAGNSLTTGITDVSKYRSVSDLNEEKETLQLLHDRINAIRIQQQQQQKYQQQSSGSNNNSTVSLSLLLLSSRRGVSPTRSTTTPSGSSNSTATPLAAGQLDPTTEVIGDGNSVPPTVQPATTTNDNSTTKIDNEIMEIDDEVNIPCLERIKRRKVYGDKLYDHLLNLKCFLDLPQSIVASFFRSTPSSPPLDTSNKSLSFNGLVDDGYTLSPLLNGVAEFQKLAYIPSYHLDTALEHYDTVLRTNQNEMDTLLNDLYPSHRKIVQIKREFGTAVVERDQQQQQQQEQLPENNNTNDPSSSTMPLPPISSDNNENNNIQVTFEQLIKKHKYLMTERYKLFCMSTRG